MGESPSLPYSATPRPSATRLPRPSHKPLSNTRGAPATPQFIRQLVIRIGEDAKLTRRITPHMLRHTCATHLLDAGVDMRYVQKLLGHQSITTTEIYTHVDKSRLKELIRSNFVRG
uniref:Phage integrase family protein n=1 Tax=Candidatus Kentrum sp. LFY TaxID=2126342 RepID=A0A450UL40_9GAMM|nr:MAG: Phage integrase family protein [Candidatus Kentron sp. LFY]